MHSIIYRPRHCLSGFTLCDLWKRNTLGCVCLMNINILSAATWKRSIRLIEPGRRPAWAVQVDHCTELRWNLIKPDRFELEYTLSVNDALFASNQWSLWSHVYYFTGVSCLSMALLSINRLHAGRHASWLSMTSKKQTNFLMNFLEIYFLFNLNIWDIPTSRLVCLISFEWGGYQTRAFPFVFSLIWLSPSRCINIRCSMFIVPIAICYPIGFSILIKLKNIYNIDRFYRKISFTFVVVMEHAISILPKN